MGATTVVIADAEAKMKAKMRKPKFDFFPSKASEWMTDTLRMGDGVGYDDCW